MSTGTALAIALGLGGGALTWYLQRDDRVASSPRPVAPSSGSSGEPPRIAAPCTLKLDASGLTIDGARTDVPSAVARCKANGKAELALSSDAPAAIHAQLTSALFAAGVPFTMKVV